jgi:cell division protein FtsB
MRWVTLALTVLIVVVQADLWLGKGSLPYVWSLEQQLADQERSNVAARERNLTVSAEVSDLKEGLEMVEDKARSELGMLRQDEILVQVTQRK